MTHQESYTVDEINGFIVWLHNLSNGMKGMDSLNFYRDSLLKSADVIEYLFAVAEGIKEYNRYPKEKIEGEKEKRDIPPTPPIESKAKEGEEKKGALSNACAREAEEEPAKKEEHVGNRSLSQARRENREADQIFEDFWVKYPSGRKYDKQKCNEKMRILYRDAEDKAKFINELYEGLERWKKSRDWQEGFVCCPLTWFNQARWCDRPRMSESALADEKQERKAEANARAAEELRRLGL